uniref:Tyrosine-protein phosphatase non-receptor type 6 n=1 Tax=Ascaris suum TaxID=6253 RepID=F1L8I6_ASCSU
MGRGSRRASKKDETKSEGPVRGSRRKRNKRVNINEDEVTQDDREEKKRCSKEGGKKVNRVRTTRSSPAVVLGKTQVTPEAMIAIDAFVSAVCAAGVDGLRKEFAELKGYTPPDFNHNQCMANESKNRYRDVVCLDATRVVLTLNVPPECDYIHASWVKMEGIDKVFIAAQGPLDETISDFWRMVFQEEVRTILMLTKTVENSKNKCAQYWPVESGAYQTYGCMFINNKKVENDDKFIISTIEVLPEGCSNSILVKLIQMTDWPDRGVPNSGMSVLRLLKRILPGGPCVVHCSAGIGRTGAVISIETSIQRLWKGIKVNVPDVLKELRAQRASSIQTEGQYVFTYLSILYYISAKIPKHRDAILKFHNDYKAAMLV